MRKLILWPSAVALGVVLAAGGLGATAAQAAACTPSASASSSGGVITAHGAATCAIEEGNRYHVTVVLYIDGENVGSSYTECVGSALSTCSGTPVSWNSSDDRYCARTLVGARTMGADEYTSTSTGTYCPF